MGTALTCPGCRFDRQRCPTLVQRCRPKGRLCGFEGQRCGSKGQRCRFSRHTLSAKGATLRFRGPALTLGPLRRNEVMLPVEAAATR
jgi:hypothetical protein